MSKKENLKQSIEEALFLRKNEKMTYSEIALKLNKPIGTIKRWLNPYGIKIKETQLKILEAGIKGRKKMMENFLNKRKSAYMIASQHAKQDLQNTYLRDFVIAYMAEGSKRSNNRISIVNSDPNIIFISVLIMKKYFLVDDKKINLRINYYVDNDNEKELVKYWQELLRNHLESIIFKSFIQPTKRKSQHNNSNKFGLITLSIYDSYAREKLNAYIDHVKTSWIKEFENYFNIKVDQTIEL